MEETESRRTMATHRAASERATSPTSAGRFTGIRRLGFALGAAVAVLVAPLPAHAAPENPTSAAEAAALVAASGHDLEVLTEQFNEAREELAAVRAEAEAALAVEQQATAELAAAQEQVRSIARTAYTAEGLNGFEALLTSDSADDFIDRVATLQRIAGHQGAILDRAAAANAAAAQARGAAERTVADAQARFDAVAAQQSDLERQIADYQKAYDQLSAQEQRDVAAASHGEDRASRSDREAPAATGPIVASSEAAQIAVDTAMAQRGKPYVWAASGPGSYDCSGLTQYAYRAAGVSLPHSSRMQSQMGAPVSRSALQPGDLIFFYSPVSHVGIYIGNGQMVHAPTSGDVVRVADIDSFGNITGMRRIVG